MPKKLELTTYEKYIAQIMPKISTVEQVENDNTWTRITRERKPSEMRRMIHSRVINNSEKLALARKAVIDMHNAMHTLDYRQVSQAQSAMTEAFKFQGYLQIQIALHELKAILSDKASDELKQAIKSEIAKANLVSKINTLGKEVPKLGGWSAI